MSVTTLAGYSLQYYSFITSDTPDICSRYVVLLLFFQMFHKQRHGMGQLIRLTGTVGELTSDGRVPIKRLFSRDLENWEEAEEPFLVTDPSFNPNICPHLFEWNGWGGNLVFREMVQHEDGSLGTKFPPEMIPTSGAPLDLPFESVTGGASGNGKTVRISAPSSFETGMLTGVPQNVRITLNVKANTNSSAFGLRMRGSGKYEAGCELRFEPSRQRVQFDTPHQGRMGAESDSAILDVEGLDRSFTLDIFLKDDVVDVCIDDRRTIVSRCWNPHGDRLFFFAQDGEVTFESVEIRPLTE